MSATHLYYTRVTLEQTEPKSHSMIDEASLDPIPFFRDLSEGARRELAARAVLRHFDEGAPLWRRGMKPRGLFIVMHGQVRVVRSSGKRQHVIHTEGPAGTLGEVPFFEEGAYPATAIASRNTKCLVLGRDAIHAAIQEDPELAFVFLRKLAARIRHLVSRLDRQVQKSVRARLAEFLIHRLQAAESDVVTLGTTQQEVAEELGTVREVVVRILRELRDEGFITRAGRSRYTIPDMEALRRIAES